MSTLSYMVPTTTKAQCHNYFHYHLIFGRQEFASAVGTDNRWAMNSR
jgi:hypothetical protein